MNTVTDGFNAIMEATLVVALKCVEPICCSSTRDQIFVLFQGFLENLKYAGSAPFSSGQRSPLWRNFGSAPGFNIHEVRHSFFDV